MRLEKKMAEGSRGLFMHEDESPMVFCLRPCSLKAEVNKQIVKGGGMCFPSLLRVPEKHKSDAICLLPDGEVSWKENTLSARYILDCAKQGRLLPMDLYACKPRTQVVDTTNDGRMPYTRKEDINILLYVRDNAGKGSSKISGNSFWKELEKLNMFQLRGRSWRSLRDRYLKKLRGRESEYPLEGRMLGPLPMPPQKQERTIHSPPPKLNTSGETAAASNDAPGSFLAQVEAKRNQLSPSLSRKEYHILISDFVSNMRKSTNLDSKSIHKVLYKCDGDEAVAEHYLLNGTCPDGYHMFHDDEDEVLLKCLLNPTTCDETPAKLLAEKLGEQTVLRRAAALLGVSRSDSQYMKSIPLRSMQNVIENDTN